MNIAIWNSSGYLHSNEFELTSIIYERNPRCPICTATRYTIFDEHVISLQFHLQRSCSERTGRRFTWKKADLEVRLLSDSAYLGAKESRIISIQVERK